MADDESTRVAGLLARIVYETVPLDAPVDRGFLGEVRSAAYRNALFAELAHRLAADLTLARLFSPGGFMSTSGLGHAAITPGSLAVELLTALWRRMEIADYSRTLPHLSHAARRLLHDTQRLAAGEVVDVPASFLFDGPELAPDRRLAGHFGRMRWMESLPLPYVEAVEPRGLMLFTTVPVQFRPDSQRQREPNFWGSSNVTQREVERVETRVRLALLDDGPTAPDPSYAVSLGPPVRVVQVSISEPFGWGFFTLNTFDPEGHRWEIDNPRAFERRLDFYARHWRPEVDLAGRRLAASAEDGRRDDDSLVDAVTAWEALLGSSTELSFRVTASLARLLRSDSEDRVALYRELRKIYGTRSKIVHGSRDLSVDDGDLLDEQRFEAARVGSAALRELLSARSDLLDLKSEDRSVRLLLE